MTSHHPQKLPSSRTNRAQRLRHALSVIPRIVIRGSQGNKGTQGIGGTHDVHSGAASQIAATVVQVSAMLRGGVAAARVWSVLADQQTASREFAEIAHTILQGHSAAEALSRLNHEAWRVFAVFWHVATVSGAPLAEALDRLAVALREIERVAERRSVLLAGPRATIRLVAGLPLVALLLGVLLGANPFALFLTPFGVGLGLVGLGLLVLGVWWARQMTKQLEATVWVSGLECELVWVALAGGGSTSQALRSVVTTADRYRARWVRFSVLSPQGAVRSILQQAATLGSPAASMLLAEATAQRLQTMTEIERAAERLAVRVLLPVGLCVLPSFIVLGVVPVLISVMGTVSF